MNNVVEVKNLVKYFNINKNLLSFLGFGKKEFRRAVDDVSFSLKEGKIFVLVGESGSGKTTLARLMLRAIDPDSGKIIFNGLDITNKTGKELKSIRKQIQMVHQDPYSSINPRMRILDIVQEPVDIFYKKKSKAERKEMALAALDEVLLSPSIEISQKYPHSLSGGERQRVALARAIVIKPKVIIADEPVSMLDVSTRAEVLKLIRLLAEKHNITFFYVTHDLATSRYVGDEIAVMYLGKIVERGDINSVLSNPLHPYTQALIDAVSEPTQNNLNTEKIIRMKFGNLPAPETGCRFYDRCLYSMEICKKEPKLEEKKGHFVACFLHDELIHIDRD